MVPPQKLAKLILHTVEKLPYDKQQEVYGFASYLKNKTEGAKNQTDSRFDSMIGILDGPPDLASNHDEICE